MAAVLDRPLRPSTTSAVRDGVAVAVPLAVGNLPFALVLGAALAAHGGGVVGWLASGVIYGGSAELASLQALDGSAAGLALVTGVLLNARMAIYAASLGRRWRDQPRWFRLAASAFVVDATWAATVERPLAEPRDERRRFLALGLVLGAVWVAGIGAGALLGSRLHLTALDVVAPLCLVALVAPRLRRREDRVVVAVAAVTAVVAGRHVGPAVTTFAAVVAGTLAGSANTARPAREVER